MIRRHTHPHRVLVEVSDDLSKRKHASKEKIRAEKKSEKNFKKKQKKRNKATNFGYSKNMANHDDNTTQTRLRAEMKPYLNELNAVETLFNFNAQNEIETKKIREALAELDEPEFISGYEHAMNWLNNCCLELEIYQTRDHERSIVKILRTCGGGYCDITRQSTDGKIVDIFYADGSDHRTERVCLPYLSEFLDELASYG